MAMAKNKHGYDVLVDFGTGLRSVRDGELIEVPDEYFRNHVVPPTWEVHGKPDYAAPSVEEQQAAEAAKAAELAAEASAEDAATTEAQAADDAAAAELEAAWDTAAESELGKDTEGEP